jgi:hypothetical protein
MIMITIMIVQFIVDEIDHHHNRRYKHKDKYIYIYIDIYKHIYNDLARPPFP